jgi:WD40 repeat protein/predicted Ser/Thr protein kinase
MSASQTSRVCQSCGAVIQGDRLCAACSLAGAFQALGFDAPASEPAVTFSPLDLPSSFGHYRVEREIAAGGMGMVYEAEDTRLSRRVALKMLRQVFFATDQDRLRFQAEAEFASQLDHPNIVPIYEVGELDGQPYFTMKYIRGRSLAERLEEGPMPQSEAAEMMAKIAHAVHHAHQRGVLHRDLKPANILLDKAGEPWLTDFGIAKLLNVESGLTMTQSVAGTPAYMSPEQAGGRRNEITTASDTWALGVIFYKMLTGKLPFDGDSQTEILRRLTEREPLSPRAITRGIDQDLETLCLRCLMKDPKRRLSGADVLADELERWSRGEPIQARRITTLERVWKWMRRHPYRAAALVAFVTFFLGAVTAITWQWRRATANAATAQRVAYSATLSQALGARERDDLGLARRLLDGISPDQRGFDWRLMRGFCQGDELTSKRFHTEPQCLALRPDGVAAVISADGRLHLMDETSAARALPVLSEEESQEVKRYYGLTFSPSGERLAYGRGDVLRVLDAASLEVLYEETIRRPQFGWLDGERLLYGFDGSVTGPPTPGAWILDFSKEKIPRTPLIGSAPLAVSADRKWFVLQFVNTSPESWMRTLHVYPSDGDFSGLSAEVYSMPGVEYPGNMALSASGRFLAFSAGAKVKNIVRVVEVASGKVLFEREFRYPVHALSFDTDESRIGLVGGDSGVRMCAFAEGDAREDDLFLGHDLGVFGIAFDSADTFLTNAMDNTVRRWSMTRPNRGLRVTEISTNYNQRQPAASEDGCQILYYWDGEASAMLLESRQNITSPVSVRHSPLAVLRDGRPVTFDNVVADVIVWEKTEDGQWSEQRRIGGRAPYGHDGKVQRARLSQDEKRLVGVLAGSLFCVNLETDTTISAWGGPPGNPASYFSSHDLSPDGEWIASSDFGTRISIHRFSEPKKTVTRLGGAARGYDTVMVFSRDGRRLYTGNEDGRIRVWDTANWQEISELSWSAHSGPVSAIAMSHDQKLIATSGGGTIKLFPVDPEPGDTFRRERLTFHRNRPANWLQFARDAQGRDSALLHSAPGQALEVWEGAAD